MRRKCHAARYVPVQTFFPQQAVAFNSSQKASKRDVSNKGTYVLFLMSSAFARHFVSQSYGSRARKRSRPQSWRQRSSRAGQKWMPTRVVDQKRTTRSIQARRRRCGKCMGVVKRDQYWRRCRLSSTKARPRLQWKGKYTHIARVHDVVC